MLTPEQIIERLCLKPLAPEGGYYAETYRADESISAEVLPGSYRGSREVGAAIYYLLTPDTLSVLHRLASDEVYHFYLGDPVEMVQLLPDASVNTLTLGHNILDNMVVQAVVPKGVWQGTRLAAGGRFALMGTTTAPAFHPADYEHGDRDELIGAYPAARDLITAFTR